MKGVSVLLLVSFAVVGALGASLYDGKSDALRDVEEKLKVVEEKKTKTVEVIKKSAQEDLGKYEKSAQEEARKRRDKSIEAFEKQKISTTAAAITKGKPHSAINCIAKVAFEAETTIPEVYTNFEKILTNFKANRLQELKLYEAEANIIFEGMKSLKEQAVKAIENAKSGFESLKADFYKKADVAEKQLSEIEVIESKVNLKNDYQNLGKQNDNKNKEVTDALAKKLQKCIA